ncbi:MAG: hypothetical protein ABI852_09605 [Gemmatimonadaceae bacterium]
MQTPPAPPAPPQAPTLPTLPQVAPVSGVSTPLANTLSYDQLRAKGSELSRQLNSATSRRDGLLRDIRRASSASKAGLQQQFDALSTRVVQIEQDIAINGQMLAQASTLGGNNDNNTSTGAPGWPIRMNDVDGTAIGVCFMLFVMSPIAIAFARNIWKRGSRTAVPASSRESDMRMERVEQAVDAIAVEVERISEGQRFVTQLMTQQPALGEGHAQPVRVPVAESAMAGYQQR